jgi:hypothetical protein
MLLFICDYASFFGNIDKILGLNYYNSSYLILISMATTAIRAAIGKTAPFFKANSWNCQTQSFQ